MKYWLLTTEYPPDFGGGISTYCLHTACMLQQQKWEVSVFVRDFSIQATQAKIEKNGIRVIRFNPNRINIKTALGFDAALSYAYADIVQQYLKKEGVPDALESQEFAGIAYYILNYKWLQYPFFKDLKIVLTLHAPSFLYYEYNRVPLHRFPFYWIGEMERFCIRAADLLIAPSQFLIDELKSRMKIDDLNIHVLPNPYVFEKENLSHRVKANRIVFFGKLTVQKGALELINYFQQLWNEGFEQPLYMIGGGDHLYYPEGKTMHHYLQRKYKKEIAEKKLHLLGAVSPGKIDEYLYSANVVIVPSLVDNLPYTVFEAMGKGKIMLASSQGGQSEVIKDGVNGFLFSHKDKRSLEKKLKTILALTNQQSEKISNEAVATIEKDYAYQVIFEKKASLIAQLIQKKATGNEFPFVRPILSKGKIRVAENDKLLLLSVVLPFYNMGHYLEEAIKSILASTYKNIEIIVVNDGSTDEQSLKALTALSRQYNFLILNKPNEGVALARNAGALAAKGEFLAFLDPDDTIEREYYQKAVKVLTTYDNVGFVGCWGKYFGNSERVWPTFNPEPPYLLTHNSINSSALVYKKDAFLKAGLNDAAMIYGMEDYESVINMVKNGFQGVVLPEPLWNYRIRKDSMARAFTTNKQLYLYRLISEKHAGFYGTFATEISNLLNANGPGINYDNPTLIYDIPGTRFIGNKTKQKIISIVKSNSLLRKIAFKIKRFF